MRGDWKPYWRQYASGQAWWWRGTGQGLWHSPEQLFLVQQKPRFIQSWGDSRQLSRSGAAESTWGLLLGLESGEMSSLPAGGVHWWQICGNCGRRSADCTASGTMAKKGVHSIDRMFTGTLQRQKPEKSSQNLSLMQWQMESLRLGKAGGLWLLATWGRFPLPCRSALQNRFGALVADDGEKILSGETSQLSLSCISTKKRWQVKAERSSLLKEVDQPTYSPGKFVACQALGSKKM